MSERELAMSDMAQWPRVAVIMRSMNEQPHTRPTLEELFAQTYTNFLIYNCDSGSTDGTLELVKEFNRIPENIVEIAPADYIPGRVLNQMVARTVEPIIVFLNADAIPIDTKWLENLLRPIMLNEADATMSRQLARAEAPFIMKYDQERGYDPKNLKGDNAGFFSAVACAFKRELWEQTKFYEKGYAEDLAWSTVCQQKGARFQLVLDSVVEHSHNFTIKGLYKKRYRHGIAFVYIRQELPQPGSHILCCAKEIVRDFLHAAGKGKFFTIPYNIVYRITIHWAYYRGKREGWRRYRMEH